MGLLSGSLSRRHFCLCCMTGVAFAATGGWLSPRQAFAEARGLVTLIKDSAASSPVTSYKLRGNVSVLEGSGGNIAVLTDPDGKVLIDGGISVSRPQLTKTLSSLGAEPITHLINTHWHFDHTSGNEWLHSVGAEIIAHSNTRKHLSEIQRVEDWDYNFLPLPAVRDSDRSPQCKSQTHTQWRIHRAEAVPAGSYRQRSVSQFHRA